MEDEFRFHIEMEADHLMQARGLAADEARRQALAAFGGVQQHKEELREGRGLAWLGSLSLDVALGGQGIPRGRIIEIFGPESSGKTTLALHVVARAQQNGGIAAFVDAEHALDPSWAKKLGVELESLLVSQPSSGEEAMNIVEMLVKSNAVDVIVEDPEQMKHIRKGDQVEVVYTEAVAISVTPGTNK